MHLFSLETLKITTSSYVEFGTKTRSVSSSERSDAIRTLYGSTIPNSVIPFLVSETDPPDDLVNTANVAAVMGS